MSYKVFDKEFLNSLGYKTPCYIYDTELLRDNLDIATKEFHHYFDINASIHYALKANDNAQVLAQIKQSGLGVDCVSGGEIEHAIACGFNPNDIVFAGVGKLDSEIILVLEVVINAFICYF